MYLKDLFKIYEKTKTKITKLETKNSTLIGEFGEILMLSNGDLFILTGIIEHLNYVTVYKISEWVDFATQDDFIFKFQGQTWVALLDELYIPRKYFTSVGMMDEATEIDMLYDYNVNSKELPASHTGLTIPYGYDYIQEKFREMETENYKIFSVLNFS